MIAMIAFMLLAAVQPASVQPVSVPAGPPAASVLATIGSDDCVSVHSDGEPWDECGFQAFAMNDDGTRILTVSSQGRIQLWDGQGRQISRLDWPNEPSGASGYPDGRALIVGDVGVAVAHYNQLAIIRLADGEILARRILDLMLVDELRQIVPGRVFAEVTDRDWDMGVREIVLPTGELRKVPGTTDLFRAGPGYWVTGDRAPFVIRRAGAAEVSSPRSCMPGGARFCFWRDDGGRQLHAFDVRAGSWRSLDVEAFDQFTMIDFVDAGGALYAVRCRPTMPVPSSRRPCSILDLADGRTIYAFEADNLRAVGALDEQGRPEIRLGLILGEGRREDRRVSADGTVRVIDPRGRANLDPPGGGLILSGQAEGTSLLVDAAGRPVALFPFAAQACGNGWPAWTARCRVSADGRRWLVQSNDPGSEGEDDRTSLTLYEIPAAQR